MSAVPVPWAPRSDPGGTNVRRTFVVLLLLGALTPLGTSDAARPGGATLGPSEASTVSPGLRRLAREVAREYQARRIARADTKRSYWLRVMQRPLPPPATGLGRLALPALRSAA